VPGYRLTVRHGSRVERESFDDLAEAIAGMEQAVEEVRAVGPLDRVKMLRDFEPGERVAARLELSTGGWLRGREAGVDVMGDGRLVAYAGGMGRRELDATSDQAAFEAVRRELAGDRPVDSQPERG
jgi:hypothetical protein